MLAEAMQIRPIDALSRDLDFQPQTVWPQPLPALAWRGYLVTGFDRTVGTAVEFQEESPAFLAELLKASYPGLGLAAASRLYLCLKTLGHPALVYAILGWRESESTRRLLETVAHWPRPIQDWCDERKLAPGDLSILLSLKEANALLPTLLLLSERRTGKNQGVRILELAGELLLMDQTLPPAGADDTAWLARLESLRFSRTFSGDARQSEKVAALPWPKQVHAQWRRRGDSGILEVQLQADSLESWLKRIEDLTRLTERMRAEGTWKN